MNSINVTINSNDTDNITLEPVLEAVFNASFDSEYKSRNTESFNPLNFMKNFVNDTTDCINKLKPLTEAFSEIEKKYKNNEFPNYNTNYKKYNSELEKIAIDKYSSEFEGYFNGCKDFKCVQKKMSWFTVSSTVKCTGLF